MRIDDIIDDALIEYYNDNKLNTIAEQHAETLVLSENTKNTLEPIYEESVLTENLFKLYLANAIAQQKAFKRPVTVFDIRKAIERTLRAQQPEKGWSEEELQSIIADQLSDEGIIGSIYYELRRKKIPYVLPK